MSKMSPSRSDHFCFDFAPFLMIFMPLESYHRIHTSKTPSGVKATEGRPNKINRGGKELEDAVKKLLLNTKDRKHIYCSGHGLLPNTPVKNVERVIEIIKN